MQTKRLILVFLSLFLILILSACSSYYNKVIETNWEIPVPKGYEELSSIDSGASFTGDRYRYHIFKYKEGSPNFSEEYYWYKKNDTKDSRNNLYLIYFTQDKMLHIIEEFY